MDADKALAQTLAVYIVKRALRRNGVRISTVNILDIQKNAKTICTKPDFLKKVSLIEQLLEDVL